MAKIMSSFIPISSRLDDVKARIDFLNQYLPIEIRKRRQKTEKIMEMKRLKMEDELLPFAKSAKIETEYLLEEKKARLKKVEEKFYWLNRKTLQSKKRDLEKRGSDITVSEIELEYDQKIKNLEDQKASMIEEIKEEYENHNGNLVEKRNIYYQKQEELNKTLETEEKIQIEKDNRYIDKLTENITKKVARLNIRKTNLEFILQLQSKESKISYKLPDDVLIRLNHLSMHFGGLKAVDDLSFDVKKGEIFGLIGPNGAGKTTVFNCITQFYKPKSGEIYYRNHNNEVLTMNEYKVHDVIREGIVRSFQNVEMVWELTVLENLLVGGHTLYKTNFFHHMINARRLKQEELVLRKKAEDILHKLGLTPYKDAYPFGLPYGILKKIELARTLMINPQLIILDEPAAGLNDAETLALAKTIRQIRDEYQTTIFLVEHDMGLVMDICDRICAISFGKMLAIGTPNEIQNSKAVRDAYLGGE